MISLSLRAGESLEVVSKLARHARPSITADLYRTVFEDEKRKATFDIGALARARDASKPRAEA